ncbi:MmcQ/YjbR family DNA-binding protein [Odoribacter laneus]|uniref:MmcQ/YjbR family DNA-binding protein n=1 Tax=Odoribacter laneus TaxID=626933 RepID=UPI0023F34082|nr:MmcQ/YjbR family DNA-binding protein [Odoribacter laneus]
MNIEELREYCLSLKNVTESFPFRNFSPNDVLVFKVENKMFLLTDLNAGELAVTLKCGTESVADLAEYWRAVERARMPGWMVLYLNRDMSGKEIKQWIFRSYQEVIQALPLKVRIKYKENIDRN